MEELFLLNENEVIVQCNGKLYQDTKDNFLLDYGKEIPQMNVAQIVEADEGNTVSTELQAITAIDYNRTAKQCWLNGHAFQKYPNEVCEDILDNIDTLLAKKAEREYVEPTPPTKEEIQKALTDGVQNWMDTKVQERNYDSVHTCVGTYLYSPVEKFRLEAEAVKDWVSYVWAKCYEILAQVEAGEREIPTLEEVIAELPVLVW